MQRVRIPNGKQSVDRSATCGCGVGWGDDIEPLGFKVVNIDGEISEDAVQDTIKLLSDKNLVDEWTSYNYSLCEKYFSHKVLRSSLEEIISRSF